MKNDKHTMGSPRGSRGRRLDRRWILPGAAALGALVGLTGCTTTFSTDGRTVSLTLGPRTANASVSTSTATAAVRGAVNAGLRPEDTALDDDGDSGVAPAPDPVPADGGGSDGRVTSTSASSASSDSSVSSGSSGSSFGGVMRSTGSLQVRALRQRNGVSCGQASVAMAINYLTGKNLTDATIHQRYGFSLLAALRAESGGKADWRDAGDLGPASWSRIENRLRADRTPVIVGLNGPEFSPSGRGHIVVLVGIEGDRVHYADPATGSVRTTTRRAIENAPPHPDGKFIFEAQRA